MNYATVRAQLLDLPKTFLRPGLPFLQWIDALTAGMFRDTAGVDGISQQISNFGNARFGWLDIWGLLFNVPRQANEADAAYKARIAYEVTAGAGTPVGIAYWILKLWGVNATIQENLPAVGYNIEFQGSLTTSQITAILISLGRIRPAGVPFTVNSASSAGLYLNTVNFTNAPKVTGAYLAGSSGTADLGLGPATNNAAPILPTLFLQDAILNPAP